MRVLVTGGAGFIGSHVVESLSQAGHDVRVLDLSPWPGSDPPAPVSLRGDVRDPDAVDRALVGVDAVCHQAAKVGLGLDLGDAPDYVSHNDLGTAVLLAAMGRAGVGRLVLASSMVVYGEGLGTCAEHGEVVPGPRPVRALAAGRFEPPCPVCGQDVTPGRITEEAAPDPRNVYAATKLAQEHLAAAWARSTGGVATALRYHNVYGPRMPLDTPYAGVAAIFRSALRAGRAPRVFEDGGQRRDFVHVRDVATANVAALGREGEGLRAYNVATGTPHTVGDMAAALAAAHAGPAPTVTGEYRLGDVRHITASADRLATELGWRPRIRFAAGMAEFAGNVERAGV
ncbi:NAD-dependent epimerase/dehydratase family protein [Streptomyces sp. SID3343]|uniref:NAD-dependent epimerase/dehydratase family protein n=1 Tax=Streptomyces sp. SID3343 TaxID=2690260 RepID=UPI00136B13B9|nr:NAD-dependent epimerase/dehydratase family protein [Streptomyces sp. SID3343]MYW00059.1 NAD-dependent epimerase/dehydratase family protein [Streptomyces sp. SID3343]